ncbi:hypothetical protein QR680_001763 [Steinernema hermaphroditum]|uniref:Uncharacterized protein n=1 Tax=Steinernema hermaphroditum TaxID=289476 RepID=A0AA39H2L1_9BILA|nr:hypothetical protein QR680_001763 [Steinernema hermaphroditum]
MCRLLALKSCDSMALGRSAAVLYLLSYAAYIGADAFALEQRQTSQGGDLYLRAKMASWQDDKTCPIYRNEALHAVLDRVCLMCHEMFSHEQPNLRVECRSSCFKNQKFRNCLSIFAPPRQNKLRRHIELEDLWSLL